MKKTSALLICGLLAAAATAHATLFFPNGITGGPSASDLQFGGEGFVPNNGIAGSGQLVVSFVDVNGTIVLGSDNGLTRTYSSQNGPFYASGVLNWPAVPLAPFGFSQRPSILPGIGSLIGTTIESNGLNAWRLNWYFDYEGKPRGGKNFPFTIPASREGLIESAVPEPSTYIAGALLLLPFAASGIRVLRKNK